MSPIKSSNKSLLISSPGKQVARSSTCTPCRKGAKFGVQKLNVGQNICSRDASVGSEKNF